MTRGAAGSLERAHVRWSELTGVTRDLRGHRMFGFEFVREVVCVLLHGSSVVVEFCTQ